MIALAVIGLTAVLTVAVIAAALSRWDGHRAEDRREAAHARPPRLAAAWWWCRDQAAWLWWKARCAAWRLSVLRWQWRRETREVHHEKFLPAPVEEVMLSATGDSLPAADDQPLRVTGRPGQPGNDGSERAGLAGREPLIIAPVAAPEAGGAPPSPALPPAVTQAFAAAWAIHGQLDDTAGFARIVGVM